jgi:hypothetical protein
MMWRSRALVDRRLGRAYIELAIHRDRVAVDDLAIELLCQRKRQRSLPASGGSKDYNQQRAGS